MGCPVSQRENMSQDEDWQQALGTKMGNYGHGGSKDERISSSTGRYWKQSGWYCAHPPAMTTRISRPHHVYRGRFIGGPKMAVRGVHLHPSSAIGTCDMAPSSSRSGDGAPLGAWTLETGGWPALELGLSLFDGQEGKGIAVEAAMAVRDDSLRCRPTTYSFINPSNHRWWPWQAIGGVLHADAATPGEDMQAWRHDARMICSAADISIAQDTGIRAILSQLNQQCRNGLPK